MICFLLRHRVRENIEPEVGGGSKVTVQDVVRDPVCERTPVPALAAIVLGEGDKRETAETADIRPRHHYFPGEGGPDCLVEGGQFLPDGGGERHGGPQTTLLAKSSLKVDPGAAILEIKFNRHGAEGIVPGVVNIPVVYEFFGLLAQKFHVCDAAEGILNNPDGLIRVVFRFFGNFECLVFNRQGESVAQDISVGYGIGAEVGVKHDGLLVRHVQRLPQCPAGINWLRGKGGEGGWP